VCQRPNRIQSVFCAHCGASISGKKVEQTYDTGRLPPNSHLKERYLVIRKIAQGGMGAIYLGTDTVVLGTKLAIKEMSYAPLGALKTELRANTKFNLEESFQREFEILRDSVHVNLPRAYDFFVEKDRPYIVMEFIDGEDFEKKLAALGADEHFQEATVINWARQLCDVLDYLHMQQPPIIYRDLKPSNVMETNGEQTLKLIDFGIARFYKPGKKGDTVRFGTYGYLAPEALSNAGQTNPVTDVYALGALLHQLLTLSLIHI
jgi:serine/threonine-protein kinase